jgi:hypothetical protein
LARNPDLASDKEVSRQAAEHAKIAKTGKSVCTGATHSKGFSIITLAAWFRWACSAARKKKKERVKPALFFIRVNRCTFGFQSSLPAATSSWRTLEAFD